MSPSEEYRPIMEAMKEKTFLSKVWNISVLFCGARGKATAPYRGHFVPCWGKVTIRQREVAICREK